MTAIETMHARGMPARRIADATGLTYRKVYDYLVYAKLKPIPLPAGFCRKGHDLSVVGTVNYRGGKGYPSGYCAQCRKDSHRRYLERQKVPQVAS